MFPLFANPAGLWVLLGVPAVVAIHFLQQRARIVNTSTWFLIEQLAPDSARGRTWDRLRTSRAFWLQLFAVILAAWVLVEPRWIRAESAQTVVIVLDASASMDAFRAPAIAAAERELGISDGLAARTTWVIMTTDPRQPALYRGERRGDAVQALARWQPALGVHDPGSALRLGRTLAGAAGRSLFITDRRAKSPADQRTVGVGHAIENVGFAGATIASEHGRVTWRALIKNHGTMAQRRTWQLDPGGTPARAESIELAPGALTEISGQFSPGIERVTVGLSDDGFALDNRLPLILPRPKPLSVSVEGSDDAAEFFRKLAGAIDGVTVTTGDAPATLRLARLDAAAVAGEPRGGIFWAPADLRAQAPVLTDPVTPERDPLVAGLNWQGWLGTGPSGFVPAPGDVTLLWHGRWPLVFLRSPAAAASSVAFGTSIQPSASRKLMLAFDWATSNAARLPATVLLARRFLEAERDVQRVEYAANFDCSSALAISGVPVDGDFTLVFEASARGSIPPEVVAIPAAQRSELRAPTRAGFFTVRRNDDVLVRGAAQFADARQGDFRAAERFVNEVRSERKSAIERNTMADPFVIWWLVLLAAAVLWSWWPGRAGALNSPQGKTARMQASP
jgi:hypothetical protein